MTENPRSLADPWRTDKNGSWYRIQDRPLSGPIVPDKHHGEVSQAKIDDDMAKLKRSRDELARLAALADEGEARNRELESTLVAGKKLCAYMMGKMPFVSGASAGGSDFAKTYSDTPAPEATRPLGGPGLTPLFVSDVLGEPDSKELSVEQRNFLRNLNASRR